MEMDSNIYDFLIVFVIDTMVIVIIIGTIVSSSVFLKPITAYQKGAAT